MPGVSAQRACKAGANDLDCATVDGFLPGEVGISIEESLCGAQDDVRMESVQACPVGTAVWPTDAETDIAAG